MRLPSISYRSLFFMMAIVAAASTILSVVSNRRLEAARHDNNAMNPFAISLGKQRDREYDFTVENYGYVYKGRTGELIDDSVLVFGAWEKYMLFFMEDYVKANNLQDAAFIDVGANSGTHTLFMAPRIKEVHAIEPFPPVLARLHANVELNKFTNVRIHEVGFGDKVDEIPFFASDESNMGGGTFLAGDRDKKQVGKLKIVAGDEFLKSINPARIGLIKMDIEGYEEAALKGLRHTLEKDRPLVIVEVTTGNHQVGGTIRSFEQLRGLFPANYEFLMFAENESQYINGNYDIKEFKAHAAHFFEAEKQKNLIAVPTEKWDSVPRKRAGK